MGGKLVPWDKYNVWSLVCQITVALNKVTANIYKYLADDISNLTSTLESHCKWVFWN